MFYGKCLDSLMKDKKNPVNSMYLHEINIKWQNVEKSSQGDDDDSLESLVNSINEFINALSNRKYKFNNSTKNGFKGDSPLFSGLYLDDLISFLIKKTGVLEQKGLSWGIQTFDTGMRYNSILRDNKDSELFHKEESSEILSLVQQFDIQMRIHGKRNFEKHLVNLPLITFYTYNTLYEDDFIKTEYFANLARQSFQRAKAVIVCESLADGYNPILKGSAIDSIFILRKGYQSKALDHIDIGVVEELLAKIQIYLMGRVIHNGDFAENGIIE